MKVNHFFLKQYSDNLTGVEARFEYKNTWHDVMKNDPQGFECYLNRNITGMRPSFCRKFMAEFY